MWLSLFVSLATSTVAVGQTGSVIIGESEGLWILRQPWPDTKAWCQNGGGSPAHKTYDIYAYYDVPHAQRMERLGKNYEAFVRDKVVPGIKQLCGANTSITELVVAMYRKRDELSPAGVVDDLSSSRTQPWDFIYFTVDGDEVTPVKHQAKDAMYHLTHAEILALDPVSKKTKEKALAASRITDYVLYERDEFKITSVFDQPGAAWCEHVYVPLIVSHEGSIETLDELIQPDYGAFFAAEIVPKIKAICPSFPNSNKYFRQTLRLEFVRAGESRVAATMGLAYGDDGRLAWREGRQTKQQIAQLAAHREEEARRAAQAQRERERQAALAQREEEQRRATAAAKAEYEFVKVECGDSIVGYLHSNTLVPYVKISTSLSSAETRAKSDELANCAESLSMLIQISNPYASSFKYELTDLSGKLFAQSEWQLTPKAKTQPLHQPEKLALFLGVWKGSWYDMEIRWDWDRAHLKGVVTSVTAKGRELGFKLGDETISASIGEFVFLDEDGIGVPASLSLILGADPVVVEGVLGILLPPADFMVFTENNADSQLMFELRERP